MCKQLKFTGVVLLMVLFSSLVTCKKKIRNSVSDNDVLEKSEVTFKYPMYAMKMPPLISARHRSNTKVDPIPVSCTSKNVTKALSELRKKIQCVPRDTVVDVVAPDGLTVSPSTVVVRRCGGMCSGNKKCISAKKGIAEFYVRTTSIKSEIVFCNSIKVTEDIECKCGCAKKKKCSKDQKFDSSTCKCVCINKAEYNECIGKEDTNFKWDPKTCSCKCKQEKLCTTGTVWVPSKCRCIKQ